MINWLFVNYLRGKDNPPLPTQVTALAFLSSVVADGDVATDWLYYNDITTSEEDIPDWLITLQLVSCICGSLSWLGVATDGRFVSWVRSAAILIPALLVFIIAFPLHIIVHVLDRVDSYTGVFCLCFLELKDTMYENIKENVLTPLWLRAKQKPSFSSGTVLFFGILVEDIPQLVVTFLIEEKIKSDHPEGQISNAALVNLLFAIFDILHKLAQAYDLRKDVQNAGYAFKRTIKAHGFWVESLSLSGVNQILSSSFDTTAKLLDAVTGKCIQVFECESTVYGTVALGTSKVLAACKTAAFNNGGHIRMFDIATGALDYDLKLDFVPNFVCVYPADSGSFFTGGDQGLQRWHMPTESASTPQLISTYKVQGGVQSIAFLDNDTFVSCQGSSSVHVWHVNKEEPTHTIRANENDVQVWSVLAMSSTMFLIGNSNTKKGLIKSIEFVNNQWTIFKTFDEHSNGIMSLTKINSSLFVSTSHDTTAKVWDITRAEPSSLFTFRGHISSVSSSVYLKEEQAVATGDKDGAIHIWSIGKYLKDEENQSLLQHAHNSDDDRISKRENQS